MHAVVPSAPVPAPLPAGTSLGQQVKAEQILDLPAQYYAVQLVAFRDKKDILDFIARHQLGDPPYGRVLRQGEVWYVLVYGVWPSKVEAEAAVAAMPPVLRSVAPWVRKLGDLQTAIRALM
ncbi:MAG: SPOR domain-containing protein [Gammaproteobacteria bacterium]|nr:SPOR domain-containing protein [Gammaproteobacteria bacterium]